MEANCLAKANRWDDKTSSVEVGENCYNNTHAGRNYYNNTMLNQNNTVHPPKNYYNTQVLSCNTQDWYNDTQMKI